VAIDITSDDARIAAGFERFYEAFRRLTPRQELSLTAASTLRRLERSGPHRLSELFGPEGVTQPAMTQLVTRLEKEGLVRRAADPADRRVVLVEPTAAGLDLVAQREAERAEALRDLVAVLDPADREAIDAALPALHRLVEKHRES